MKLVSLVLAALVATLASAQDAAPANQQSHHLRVLHEGAPYRDGSQAHEYEEYGEGKSGHEYGAGKGGHEYGSKGGHEYAGGRERRNATNASVPSPAPTVTAKSDASTQLSTAVGAAAVVLTSLAALG